MSSYKYVAAGFMKDATKLFNDFAKYQTNDFTKFSKVWREHKFMYIFMGRPDKREFLEFTCEIYQLTLSYMMSSTIDSQIAAVYLLYSLYKTQNVISPVKIRTTQSQYQVLLYLHAYSIEKKIYHLHYILDFLKKNCLDLVANGTLYGPCTSNTNKDSVTPKPEQLGMLTDLKQDMTIFQESNILKDLKKMRAQYLQQKESIMPSTSSVKDTSSDILNEYEKFDSELEVLTGQRRSSTRVRTNDDSINIGNRRAELKNYSFERKAMFRCLNPEEETVEDPVEFKVPKVRKRRYNKRLPVHLRKIGRPKKNPDFSSEESEEEEMKLPVTQPVATSRRGTTGRNKVSYLKMYEGPAILKIPKQEPSSEKVIDDISDEQSDVDDLVF